MGGIVWIASFPKSGNTWVRAFLDRLLLPPGTAPDLNRMQETSPWEIDARWFRGLLPRPLAQCSMAEIAAVRARAQARIAAAAPGLIFVKTHNALFREAGHPLINARVTAGAVYVVRNPLDVAVSYAHHLAVTLDVAIAAMNLGGARSESRPEAAYEVFGSWSEHVASWTRKPHAGLHVMRYEDMLADPVTHFTALCRFLRIDAGDGAIAAAVAASSFGRLQAEEAATGFAEKPFAGGPFFRSGRAGTGRALLSADQAAAVTAAHDAQMRRFGYCT